MNRPNPEQGYAGGDTFRVVNLVAAESAAPQELPFETYTERMVYQSAYAAGLLAGYMRVELENKNAALEAAEHRADTDDLTGLYNRDYLINGFRNLQQAATRRRKGDLPTPHSILAIDADYFKVVNDTYGHPVGDQVLVELAQILRAAAKRDQDIAARFGGEEFCLLLPHTTLDEAASIAKSIRLEVNSSKSIAQILWSSSTQKGRSHKQDLTVSVGVAELDLTKTFDENHHNVDVALYTAKRLGRDTVFAFTPPTQD
jgi:diguanylate cyclase (GGDEF)-like protein